MCGRYTLKSDPAELRGRFPVGETVEVRRRYNVAPGDDVLAITCDRDGRPRGELLRWGLRPAWSDSEDTGYKMINARAETVLERAAFRRAFERGRCLILADGFYEWQPQPDGSKQPFHITLPGGEPFAFAGMCATWHGEDGSRLRSCTILTTAANAAVATLHDRMPVILEPRAEQAWLDRSSDSERLAALLHALPASRVALRPVSSAVNDARYDRADCLAPPAQTTLF